MSKLGDLANNCLKRFFSKSGPKIYPEIGKKCSKEGNFLANFLGVNW